jgi:hypothetical protein
MEAVARAKAGMPSISTMISAPTEGIVAMASSAMPAVQSLATIAPPPAGAGAAQFLIPSLSTWRPGMLTSLLYAISFPDNAFTVPYSIYYHYP